MVEPLAADLDNVAGASIRTLTTEEDRKEQEKAKQQEQVKQQLHVQQPEKEKGEICQKERPLRPESSPKIPTTAAPSIGARAIAPIHSEEFQIYEDNDNSETEWGSCAEFDDGPTGPQHLRLKRPTSLLGEEESSSDDNSTDITKESPQNPARKSPTSLRAPMNHDEMNQLPLMQKEEEQEKEKKQAADKYAADSLRNGTTHSKPPEIEVQLKSKQRDSTRENHSNDDDSHSDVSSSRERSPVRRPLNKFQGSRQQEEQRNQSSLGQEQSMHNRIGQMKSRWNSIKGSFEGSEASSSDDDSSSSEVEESLSDDESDTERPTTKRRRQRISAQSAPDDQTNLKSSRRDNNRRGEGLSAPGDRRTAMLQSQRPSGNRMKALMAFKEATKSVRSNMTGRENFNFRSIVRKSREIDMETGATLTREFTAKRVDDEEYFQPMNPADRRKSLFLKKRLNKKNKKSKKEGKMKRGNNPMNYRTTAARSLFSEESDEPVHQYRLSSMIAKDDSMFFSNRLNLLREYLYWCFRKGFVTVLITESIFFLAWCWFFAVLYWILGNLNPQCILGPDGVNFEEGQMGLVDAFTLSWTTFSTVGYGHIHPAIHGEGSSTHCIFVTCLASLQSFVGVLSASFCSAIIFAKIAKYQSIAHVMFSQSVVIRFGQELMQDQDQDSTHDLFSGIPDPGDGTSVKSSKSGLKNGRANPKLPPDRRRSSQSVARYPCPIMEFRVVNLLHNEKGGEIMNCKLNVVASTLEEVTKRDKAKGSNFFDNVLPSKQVAKSMKVLHNAAKKATSQVTTSGELMKRGSALQKLNRTVSGFAMMPNQYTLDGSGDNDAEGEPFKEGEEPNGDYFVNVDDPFPDDGSVALENLMDEDISSCTGREEDKRRHMNVSQSIFVDEEPCGEGDKAANSRRVFSKVELETDSHPFFKRVWNIRHVLNETSPLLTEETRKVIQLNGGLWPSTLCSPDVIKECLDVSQLIVSLSGTAVVSGSSVYKLHVYERGFVEIGRTFENPLGRGQDGKLTVDLDLVHATIPQFEEKYSEEDEQSLNQGRLWGSFHM